MRDVSRLRKLLMSIKPSSHHGDSSLRERFWGVVSKGLLLLSLLCLFCMNAARAVVFRCRSFYYDVLYHPLERVRGAFDALRHSRLQALSLIVTVVVLLPMVMFMRVGVAVTVDGRVLGYVQDEAAVKTACRTLEAASSEVLGAPFSLDADISYAVGVTTQNGFLTPAELPSAIAENVDSLATLAVVKVDGETVGACAEAAQAQQVLREIRSSYAAGAPNAEVRFVQEVAVETLPAPATLLGSEEELKQTLLSTTLQAQSYTVTETDTMTSIAQEHGMLLNDLLALNPTVVPERMAPGSTVTLKAATPLLSVQVIKTVDYTEAIAFDTQSSENASLAKGKTKVVQQGADGLASVCAEITEINGVEQSRKILTRTVTKEPVCRIIEEGTRNMGIGTGSLIRPIAGGTITSGYKYRWGRMHKGIDIAASTGTAVRAADNGKVIVSEYSRGYGNYIIINHGNGMKTLYGHNSRLLVEVGDVVEQGQTIARSGNTGNSTGPHCHFEVLIDDENVNPANYV